MGIVAQPKHFPHQPTTERGGIMPSTDPQRVRDIAKARSKAQTRLAKKYPDEYSKLYREACNELGISIRFQSTSKARAIAKQKAKIAKLQAQLKELQGVIGELSNSQPVIEQKPTEEELFRLWKASVALEG
jgi:5'-deoxynucleotidase YfbR-like HD superfamily hydrolase